MLIGAGVWAVFKNRQIATAIAQKTAALQRETEARGWGFASQPSRGGRLFTFNGKQERINWQLEMLTQLGASSEDSGEYSLWRTDTVTLPGEVILIVPNLHNAIQFGAMSAEKGGKANPLVRAALGMYIKNVLHGDPQDAAEFDYVSEVHAGSEEFRSHYIIRASSESSASLFLEDGAQAALVECADGDAYNIPASLIALIFWKNGLTLRFNRAVTGVENIEAVNALGVAIAGEKGD